MSINIKQAKQIPLTGILQQLGHEPVARRSTGDLRYLSPFRQESEPSFDVNPQKNIWHDFAIGGGTVIDFAMQYFSCASVSDALRELEAFRGVAGVQSTTLPLFPEASSAVITPTTSRLNGSQEARSPAINIKKVQPLQNTALVQYIERRGIPLQVARPFVQEAYYTVRGKDRTFFALAFANESGGYELRNPGFQAVAGNKDISLIDPENRELFEVIIFEGFLDFMSALVSWGLRVPQVPVLVMNSVSLKDRAIAAIHARGYTDVHLYLDRDDSGRQLTRDFQTLEGLNVVDRSHGYAGYKDFNAHLMGEKHPEWTNPQSNRL